jgi:hypothetical protein
MPISNTVASTASNPASIMTTALRTARSLWGEIVRQRA